MEIKRILQDKKFVVSSFVMQIAIAKQLTIEDTFLLIYFLNTSDLHFDMQIIKSNLPMEEHIILNSFNTLISKKLIKIESSLDADHRMEELVSLEPFYEEVSLLFLEKEKKNITEDIFTKFEIEFARPLSSTEIEIIKAWIEKGFSEELVFGALKEAVYNGVRNLRYIEKILFEWSRKGFKTMADVKQHLEKRETKKEESELFDYNWLEDDE